MLDGIWQQDCSALWMPQPETLDNYPPERSDRALWLAVGIALGLHAVCFAGLWHLPSPLAWSAETAPTVLRLTMAPPQPLAPPREPVAAQPVPAPAPHVSRPARHVHTPKSPPHPQPAASVPAVAQPAMPHAVTTTITAAVTAPSVAETAPVILTTTLPVYPSTARRRRLQGVVVVAVEVAADGVAQSVVVQRSSGHAVLDNAAVNTARNWRFTPARRDGQAVRAEVQVPVRFRLTGEQ